MNKSLKELSSKSIYQLCVRNHSAEGTFKAVTEDLDRIKAMGFDYIDLLPVQPTGKAKHIGKFGSPYAIRDYMKVNEDFGTMDEFKALIAAIHNSGMKVILDIALNSTARDSVYYKEHPEYFLKGNDGKACCLDELNKDIFDLDYNNQELWAKQIEMLQYWVELGIDGYRVHHAMLLPLDFLKEAHKTINAAHKKFVWIAENASIAEINHLRQLGYETLSESELYKVFDAVEGYETFDVAQKVMHHDYPLSVFKDVYGIELNEYANDKIKVRRLENVESQRLGALVDDETILKNWLAYSFFTKGLAVVCEGQEFGVSETESIINKSVVELKEHAKDYSDFIAALNKIRKEDFFKNHLYFALHQDNANVLCVEYRYLDGDTLKAVIGVFNVSGEETWIDAPIRNGFYNNKIDNEIVVVTKNQFHVRKDPIIVEGICL